MFWFCKPKPVDVHFYTTREEVFNHARPEKAVNFLPNWWKALPKQLDGHPGKLPLFNLITLKSCPAITNLYTSGYMFPLWSDLHIEVENGNYKYQFVDRASSIEDHPKEQFGASDLLNEHIHLKLINPWSTYCKEKINFLTVAPTWNNFGHGDIIVLPGSFHHRFIMNHNINLLIRKTTKKTYSLNFKQPLIHVIPLTDRPVKLHYELISEKELNSLIRKAPLVLMGSNRYRRAEKLCPHV